MTIHLYERRSRSRRLFWLGILAVCLASGGCSDGQNVTAPGIKAAALFVVRNGKIILWQQVAVPKTTTGKGPIA